MFHEGTARSVSFGQDSLTLPARGTHSAQHRDVVRGLPHMGYYAIAVKQLDGHDAFASSTAFGWKLGVSPGSFSRVSTIIRFYLSIMPHLG
jgi:hypothetical protein